MTGDKLVGALARIDAAAESNRELTAGLRNLLWDLNGPFAPPGTFRGADERLITALDELENVSFESGQASRLIAEIWRLSLNRERLFRQRRFNAEVHQVSGPASTPGALPSIYACPGNQLAGMYATLWTTSSSTTGPLVVDVKHLNCSAPDSLSALLSGKPAQLGLDATAFTQLFPDGTTPSDGSLVAYFHVYPRDFIAAGAASLIARAE